MAMATQARRLDFSAVTAATAMAIVAAAGLPSTALAQKGPQPAAACTGPGPSGMVFAVLDELCPVVAEIGTARLERDSNGERYIAATVNNINFAVDVYNCEPDCADLSFTASFEMDGLTIDQMNEWNSSRRFGKAYIRDDGDAVIQIAINTRHGISLETFRDDLVWWETVIEDYVEFIGFR
jgi:hypothetical protein